MRFWDMTIDEILCAVYGHHQRMKWQATLVYTIPTLIGKAFAGEYPAPDKVFPGLLEAPEQAPNWQVWKERVLAHGGDYKRRKQP